MARLRGDDDAGAAGRNHLAEQLQHQGRPVEVDLEDDARRRLAGRDAGGVDQAGDRAEGRGGGDQGLNAFPRGDVDHGDVGLVAGVGQHLGGGLGVLALHVGQQHALADAYTSGDRLADLAGPDDYDDVAHEPLLGSGGSHSALQAVGLATGASTAC
nr:hypothetical protein [Caulobacter sp. D4A]